MAVRAGRKLDDDDDDGPANSSVAIRYRALKTSVS